MAIPTGGDIPSQYRPNARDDRSMNGTDRNIYADLATAIEAIEDIDREALDPQTLKAIKSADSALRRAAFSLVVHHRDAVLDGR